MFRRERSTSEVLMEKDSTTDVHLLLLAKQLCEVKSA